MGRWRWYWSQGRKSAEGRQQRGSLGLASRKACQAALLRDAREVGALAGGAGGGVVGGEGEGE
eukprot:2537621-Prymnesium_polylepis.1